MLLLLLLLLLTLLHTFERLFCSNRILILQNKDSSSVGCRQLVLILHFATGAVGTFGAARPVPGHDAEDVHAVRPQVVRLRRRVPSGNAASNEHTTVRSWTGPGYQKLKARGGGGVAKWCKLQKTKLESSSKHNRVIVRFQESCGDVQRQQVSTGCVFCFSRSLGCKFSLK